MKNLTVILALTSVLIATSASTVVAQQAPAAQYDYGNQTSAVLTEKAWGALQSNDLAAVKAYTGRCFELYASTAFEQQASLKEPVPTANPEAVHAMWALNDVGTCYFVLGQALEKAGQPADAIKAYKVLVEKLAFAKCWDTKGWFWGPADAAKGRIKALEFDAM